MRTVLTFQGVPVVGHRVSWGIATIYDKAEVEVPTRDATYSTYGHMSGEISTTPADGGATAAFFRGYNFGQLVFNIYDQSVRTRIDTPILRSDEPEGSDGGDSSDGGGSGGGAVGVRSSGTPIKGARGGTRPSSPASTPTIRGSQCTIHLSRDSRDGRLIP